MSDPDKREIKGFKVERNSLLENILRDAEALSLPELEALRKRVMTLQREKEEEAASLLRRLKEIGMPVEGHAAEEAIVSPSIGPKSGTGSRQRPPAKYRSKKDPSLTWSGRGHLAGWLAVEMEELGLPKDAFLITAPQSDS